MFLPYEMKKALKSCPYILAKASSIVNGLYPSITYETPLLIINHPAAGRPQGMTGLMTGGGFEITKA
jgi:hypothetical protein